jgi:alkylation response protein AidB-like acyl-CoA dehydrogenase
MCFMFSWLIEAISKTGGNTMDFAIPADFCEEIAKFETFIKTDILPDLPGWSKKRELPRALFRNMGKQGWYGLKYDNGSLHRRSALKESIISETLARVSPGVAIAALAHTDLGLMGLFLFGSKELQQKYGAPAVEGKTVMCLGNTENIAETKWNQGLCHEWVDCRLGCHNSRLRSRG